ncbi:MAG: hypothetical protein RJA57_1073 [Bacteroidota bacterium]|jgi:hypothetical protein
MKKKVILAALATSMVVYLLSSCYKNKEDVPSLPQVSFRKEVVPIMTSGACGCHNTSYTIRAVLFSDQRIPPYPYIYYDAILSRASQFAAWINGGTHPGGGAIDFNPSEKNIIRRWIAEGAKDDGSGCTVPATVTYTNNIVPIYNTSCKGSTCHGGIAVTLDYAKMVSSKNTLTTIMNSGGAQGHPPGQLSLSTCSVNIFKEWLSKGQPQ